MNKPGDTAAKLKKLKNILKKTNGLAVAFSGGVDSSYLLKTAADVLGGRVLAVIARSSTYPVREFKAAAAFVKKYKIPHEIIISEELEIDGFSKNPADRCYFCKRELFKKVIATAKQHGLKYAADGSNADDAGDYRPGMRAVKELKVLSPLKQAGLTKQEIRLLSKKAGLSTWDKPAMACLASRFPYGNEITRTKLGIVEKAELALFALGFKQVRVRHHGDIARIETAQDEIKKFCNKKIAASVDSQLKKLGFKYVAFDLSGYRTGSMNDTLPAGAVKRKKS